MSALDTLVILTFAPLVHHGQRMDRGWRSSVAFAGGQPACDTCGPRFLTMPTSDPQQTLRFGDFELDVADCQLRRDGRPVRLERQPMDLLLLLVQRPRQLVLRADIVARLWRSDVFVDVETGVNTAVRKLRQALNDSPEAPMFVETVPGRGYRFVANVEVVQAADSIPSAVMVAVLPFENLGSDPKLEHLADGLTEETIATLGQIDPEHLNIIGRTSSMAYKGSRKSLAMIGGELNVQYLIEGSIQGETGLLRIRCTLVRVRDQAQVWSASYDREPTSLLSVQQELSTAIATQIKLRLSPARFEALSRRHTRDADAYDLLPPRPQILESAHAINHAPGGGVLHSRH